MLIVAIGANLARGDAAPLATCAAAAREVAAIPELARLGPGAMRLSSWFDTRPVPDAGGPRYVNGVVGFDLPPGPPPIDPRALLDRLQAIEASFGRVRTVRDAARTLDLDIVAIGGLVRDAPDPVLPHPRAHLRRFVLEPLAEIAPGWRHPALDRPVEALLSLLPDQGVRRLPLEGGGRSR